MDSSEAGASSGSEYQVFLSFRGPDTRSGFTNCLYHSLLNAGIYVFQDDEELRVGERIDGALERGINNSRIYIPIFSQNYASSKWCLRELAQIVENTSSNRNKEILPIFFDVKPDDVKLKTPLYRNAIVNLEREKNLSTKQVDSWREALEKVDAIKGWEAKKYKGEGELINLVVEEVVKKLKIKQKFVTEHLIGIDDQVVAVKKLLDVDSGGGQLIQIYGMGGIGKTTLAKVVFNQLSTHFGKCCYFLEDVREKSSITDGLLELQNKLLSEIGNATRMGSVNETNYGMKRIQDTLCRKKVFIVLDDVDKSEQVENLVGKGTLCSGSRILITTRNKNVLQITRPKYKILKYEMNVMSSDNAFQLFNRHAFNSNSHPDDDHDISKKIVLATGRLPLTIKVIGSMLHNEKKEVWKETLDKLSKTLPVGVYEKLKISYDALTFEQQQIFLDIACFFIGKEKTNAIYMWNDCGLFPIGGIAILERMSLIRIVKDNKFWMHDQLRDLGREIVRQENPNPEKRSRLWINEEVLDTIKTKKMKKVEAMELEWYPLKGSIKSEDVGRFEKLRFLRLKGETFVGDLMDCFPKLKWIYWSALGVKCELTNMCLKNVVVLEFSNIAGMDDMKLWNLIKEARKLKVLSIERCTNITKTPDLSGCSTLERLNFSYCNNLMKIDGSIGKLKCLKDLKFHWCYWLEVLPEEIGDLQNLENFSLKECWQMKELPNSIFKCKSLRELHLQILGPVELSSDIGKLENLEVLRVESNLKGQLPSEIGSLLRLQNLVLRDGCHISKLNIFYRIPGLRPFSQILTHQEVSSTSLQVVLDLSNLTNLVDLDLCDSSKMDEQFGVLRTGDLRWIERLSELKELSLCLPHVTAPTELASLPQLNRLCLSGLNLQPLKQVPPSLLEPTLHKFNSIALLSSCLKNLSFLELSHAQMQEFQIDGLQLPNLTKLSLDRCGHLERFMLSSMGKLKAVHVGGCPKLDGIHVAGVLNSLEDLWITGCASFTRFMYDILWESSHESSLILASTVFNELQRLHLHGLPKILGIQVVGTWLSLAVLSLDSCHHLESLGGLSNLKNLNSLEIYHAHKLRIVEGLSELKFLQRLALADCRSLESSVDIVTTELPNDCCLYIHLCPKLLGVDEKFTGFIQSFKHYTEEDSVPAASTDPWIIWHPPMVSRAESSTQAQMRTPGKKEEFLAPFEEEDSVPAASTDPWIVWHPPMVSRAESSTQAQMRTLGKEEFLAPFEGSSSVVLSLSLSLSLLRSCMCIFIF